MKKKLALLFTVTAVVTSLFIGCGSTDTSTSVSSDTEKYVGEESMEPMSGTLTPKSIIDSSSPVIGYLIQNPDKDEVPGAVVIFQEGKATWYKDTKYTMGDFSKMTDSDVVKNLSGEVATENKKQLEEYEAQIKEYQEKNDTLNTTSYTYAWSDYLEKIMVEYENQIATELNEEQYSILSSIYTYYSSQLDATGSFEDAWNKYVKENPDEDVCSTIGSDDKSILDTVKAYDALAHQYSEAESAERDTKKASKISENQTEIDKLNEQISKLQSDEVTKTEYKTLIDIKTDESSNEVNIEAILLMDNDGVFMGMPLNSYSVDYTDKGTEIYDSTYYGYAMTDGESGIGYLFFRDSSGSGINLKFDDFDTAGVFVDVEDENELLK
jgi:hypothetical protein